MQQIAQTASREPVCCHFSRLGMDGIALVLNAVEAGLMANGCRLILLEVVDRNQLMRQRENLEVINTQSLLDKEMGMGNRKSLKDKVFHPWGDYV